MAIISRLALFFIAFLLTLLKVFIFFGGIMRGLLIFLVSFSSAFLRADILLFADKNKTVEPLDVKGMVFIAETLTTAKPALNLDCDVKVREIKKEQKFSDGVHIVEMLEIIYHNRMFYGLPEQKSFFPLTSTTLSKSQKNTKLFGVIEEIQLEAEDAVNSRFIFQHDGRGEIVWMSYEDDTKTVPCRFKIR